MFGFLEWLAQKDGLLLETVLLSEARTNEDIETVRKQINKVFDEAILSLVRLGKICQKTHIQKANELTGYDWWSYLVRTMRAYPFKGPDLYDAATHLAGDLWENVFNANKYEDKHPPLLIFHRMANIRGQDIAFKFFGWRRKLKTTNSSDCGIDTTNVTDKSDLFSDLEWQELKQKLLKTVAEEAIYEKNQERAKRAIDVMGVKLNGFSKTYNRKVSETGLDSLAAFYHVNRREMYDTLLIVYRATRKVAQTMPETNLLDKVMGQLPPSLCRDPEEIILSFIPSPPKEISHSDLFSKVYSCNRELKALLFKQIIQKLTDSNLVQCRKDERMGKHQMLYRLTRG